jgi:putative addiction module component (TIGR02574 family)
MMYYKTTTQTCLSRRKPEYFPNIRGSTVAMTERYLELLQQALSLTEEERADLAAPLLDSLDVSPDPDAEALWQEEIVHRTSDLDSGKAKTIPWREVESRASDALQHGPKKR